MQIVTAMYNGHSTNTLSLNKVGHFYFTITVANTDPVGAVCVWFILARHSSILTNFVGYQ